MELPALSAGRVQLRWLTTADVPALFAVFGDPVVTRYWGHPVLPDLTAAGNLLTNIHNHFHQRTLFQWGVELIATRDVIGTCILADLDAGNRRAQLGFALGRVWWGQGYMAEALLVLLDFAFRRLHLHRLIADADPQNGPSLRVLVRLGFCREGILREHYLVQGKPQDAVVHGLLRSESRWAAQAPEPNRDG
jgi:[ribosomal protein S5]-alanine N-acetyltransferase